MTPEERAKVSFWKETAQRAGILADQAHRGVVRDGHPPLDTAALVSIALSLSVIAEVVTLTLAEEAERG